MRLLSKVPRITLIRCSPAMVAQLNSVYNFRGSATIKSVAAPFFCPKCDTEQLEVIETDKKIASPAELIEGERVCTSCGGAVEFDDLVERYFLFLGSVE